MASGGRTVLFVSHNINAVQRLCTRCLWLDAGRVVADGPTLDVTRQYLAETAGDASLAVPGHWRSLHGASRHGTGDACFEAVQVLERPTRRGGTRLLGRPC